MASSFTGLDPYKLHDIKLTGKELGIGSYAVVFELEYKGRKCAGKKIHDVLLKQGSDTFAIRHFKEECQLLCKAHHPNIVEFLGVHFEDDKQAPILVMELLDKNLTLYMKEFENQLIPMNTSYSILHGVAKGLCYLHDQSPPITHRDLSSNNILLTSNLMPKIADLGMARILNMTPLKLKANRMTQTPGTPAYMPPEVMVADPIYDKSIDTFSYGILMIHIFSGQWPEPRVGPVCVKDGGDMIPVSEADRRQDFLQFIGDSHPLMQLILTCIDNNPKKRPHCCDIKENLTEMVQQFNANSKMEKGIADNPREYVEFDVLDDEINSMNLIDLPEILSPRKGNNIPSSQRNRQQSQGSQLVADALPNCPIYIANYLFDTNDEKEMSFKKGDQMYILGYGNGDWWYAQSVKDKEKKGFIPRNYVTKLENLETEKWFFGSMSRATAEQQLLTRFNQYGSYLVRRSESYLGAYSLSVRSSDGIKHYLIKQQENGLFSVGSGIPCVTITQLIAYYQQQPERQLDELRYPCNHSGEIQSTSIGDGRWKHVQKQNQVKMVKQISTDQFVNVWGGLWGRDNLPVTITMLKPGTVAPLDFVQKASLVKRFSHENVVKFYSLCAKEIPTCFVIESTRHGELLNYIQREGRSLKHPQLIQMASQVAAGMAYLEKQNFVHQDLAARNIMVAGGLVCKVQANFGLSLVIGESHKPFSTKWTAPEAYLYNKFTTKSDVWSFGVVLYEIITYCLTPYPSMTDTQVMKQLQEGYRMLKPKGCPNKLYSIMLNCWTLKPEHRPTFETLQRQLQDLS